MWKSIAKVCYSLQHLYIEKSHPWLKVKGNTAIPLHRDRIRTAVNVVGDAYGAGIVEHLSRNDLMSMDYSAREDGVPMEPFERYTPKNEDTNNVHASDPSLRATNF